MFMDLMKEGDDEGNNTFRTLMPMDDEMAQDALSKTKQACAENGKKFGVQKLSFEAVEQWIRENRNTAQQAVKAQQEKANQEQEKAMQEAERREHEVRKFKEEQKQIMIEKEKGGKEVGGFG